MEEIDMSNHNENKELNDKEENLSTADIETEETGSSSKSSFHWAIGSVICIILSFLSLILGTLLDAYGIAIHIFHRIILFQDEGMIVGIIFGGMFWIFAFSAGCIGYIEGCKILIKSHNKKNGFAESSLIISLLCVVFLLLIYPGAVLVLACIEMFIFL